MATEYKNREKQKERPKKGIALCRVSTLEQARTGTSLESQEEWAKRISSEMGVELVEIIKEDVSGEKFPRKNTNHILELAKKREIGYFYVYAFDRLCRLIQGYTYILELWKNDVQTVTSTLISDMDRLSDRIQVTVAFICGETEQDSRLERITRGMITKLRRGEYPLPHLPFGYERVDGKLRLIPEYKTIIQDIFQTFLETRSYAETARRINEKYGRRV